LINNKEYPWTFVLIDSEERTATLTMIDKSRPFFTSPKQKTTIEDFNNCALMTKKGFMESSLQLVAQAMNHTSKLLEEASVVSEKTKEMITTSLDIGALAAKTTGAGGGGCILVLLDPTQKVQQIEQLTDCYGEKNIHEFNL
jgi:mevalonate kinase